MSDKRMLLPDLLKGIAVMLMMQVHLTELFAVESFYTGWIGKVSLFLGGVPAAPLFMAVMGFFISKSDPGLKHGIFRGLKLIFWGFLLNIGLNFHLLSKIFYRTIIIDPLPYLFGVDILFLAGLSIIVITVLRRFLRENVFAWSIIAMVIASVAMFLPEYSGNVIWVHYLQAYFFGSAWWSYFPVFPWTTYVLLGFIFGLLFSKPGLPEVVMKYRKLIGGISFILILLTIKYGFRVSVNLFQYYHHGITFVIWAAVFLIFLIVSLSFIAEKYSHNKVIRYLSWTGKNVTSFYAFQWLIIGNIATGIFKTQAPVYLPLWYAGIVIIVTLLVLGWSQRAILKEIVK